MPNWLAARFSRKLAALLVLTVCGAMALAGLAITRSVRAHLLAELSENLRTQAGIMALRPGRGDLSARVREFGNACACRVTLIDADGAVLADNDITEARLKSVENHASRPEVHAALSGVPGHSVRHSATLGIDFLYSAVPWPLPGRTGALRLALPLEDVERKTGQTGRVVLWTTLAVLLVTLPASLWLAAGISRPVREMSAVAERLAGGDYSARVRRLPKDEHGRLAQALNLLAAEVEARVRELSLEKSELASILSGMVEAVVAVDAKGRIIVANPALGQLFGVDPEAATGQPLLETLRHAEIDRLLRRAAREGTPASEEIRLFAPEERLFEAHASPVGDGALLVLHDITRLRRLEAHRRDFVANVSHELRTPLASIKGLAETLRGGAAEDLAVRDEFLADIEKGADRLTALVDDLLDLSAIESGKRRPALSEVSGLDLARDVCAALAPAARRRAVTLEVSEAGWAPVRADPAQLRQVLTNLVDNAVKFNREGGRVTVSARVEKDRLVVSVEDTGLGIPLEDQPRIFERFYRVDKARSREMGGTGLGLSIVKHIVEAHGGSVSLRSEPGRGATFSFALPLASPAV